MSNPEQLLMLCRVLCSNDHTLADDILISVNDPWRYMKEFHVTRGITKPYPELPWLALVLGLPDRASLVELNNDIWASDVLESRCSARKACTSSGAGSIAHAPDTRLQIGDGPERSIHTLQSGWRCYTIRVNTYIILFIQPLYR